MNFSFNCPLTLTCIYLRKVSNLFLQFLPLSCYNNHKSKKEEIE